MNQCDGQRQRSREQIGSHRERDIKGGRERKKCFVEAIITAIIYINTSQTHYIIIIIDIVEAVKVRRVVVPAVHGVPCHNK